MGFKEFVSKASQLGDWRGGEGGEELVRIFVKSHLIMRTARKNNVFVTSKKINRILNIKGLFCHYNQ